MKIIFKNGEKVIDHESGVRTKYQKIDLDRLVVLEEKSLAECAARLADLHSDIKKIQNSIGAI